MLRVPCDVGTAVVRMRGFACYVRSRPARSRRRPASVAQKIILIFCPVLSTPVGRGQHRSLLRFKSSHISKREGPKVPSLFNMRMRGFEPPRSCLHWTLNPARLPFRHIRNVPEVRLELTRFVTNPRILSPVRLPVPPLGPIKNTLFFCQKYVNIFCVLRRLVYKNPLLRPWSVGLALEVQRKSFPLTAFIFEPQAWPLKQIKKQVKNTGKG